VFIVVYFVIDSVWRLLDTPSYILRFVAYSDAEFIRINLSGPQWECLHGI